MKKEVLLYGLFGGLLVVALRFAEYRFLVLEHSLQIYGVIVASLCAAAGIWLGFRLTKEKIVTKEVTREVLVEVPAGGPFVLNASKIEELSVTARELEVLQLIAEGLSTKQMAERLFVSENTIKTHCSRVFDKLGVNRRTQAVQAGKQFGLIR